MMPLLRKNHGSSRDVDWRLYDATLLATHQGAGSLFGAIEDTRTYRWTRLLVDRSFELGTARERC